MNFLLVCWPKTNIIHRIKQQYGLNTLTLVRRLEKTFLKLTKVDLDIIFLKQCQRDKLLPTFCKLKPANKHNLSHKDLTSLQEHLLSLELEAKYRNRTMLNKAYSQLLKDVRTSVSFITYISIRRLIRSSAKNLDFKISNRHSTKLESLRKKKGSHTHFLDLSNIVVNLSSTKLSDTEVDILSRGLAYSVPPLHLDKTDIMTSFEGLFGQVLRVKIDNNTDSIKHKFRSLCFNYIYGYNSQQFSNLTKAEQNSLKHLTKRDDIVFCKPDKSNGVVILDKVNYIKKVYTIIDDKTKFKMLERDPTGSRESSLQRYLRFLKNQGILDDAVYEGIRPVGSVPGRIYGLPKIHKNQSPLRPIISSINTYTYKLSRFLVDILKPLTVNDFSAKDSFSFVNEILSIKSAPYMCSFDVVSLFTNIPLDQTINICIRKLFE